jgi:predicted nucleic acid-binding protein
MRSIALDTNAYTALGHDNQTVANIVSNTPMLGLPLPVLGEIYYGMFNGSKTQANQEQLRRFLQSPRLQVLSIDETTAKIFGEIAAELRRTGKPIQHNDMWIAALCKQYDYPLLTADRDFERVMGLEVVGF